MHIVKVIIFLPGLHSLLSKLHAKDQLCAVPERRQDVCGREEDHISLLLQGGPQAGLGLAQPVSLAELPDPKVDQGPVLDKE